MSDLSTWIAGFLNRVAETREMDQLLQRLSDTLEHPCHMSVIAALKNSWQSVISGETSNSMRWAQVVADFSWEMLNVGNWKDVSTAWRELYSLGALLKALNLCANRDFQSALRELDKGILLGAPLFNDALPSFASLLNREIRAESLVEPCSGTETCPPDMCGHDRPPPDMCRHDRPPPDMCGHDRPPPDMCGHDRPPPDMCGHDLPPGSPPRSPHDARQVDATSKPSRKLVFRNYLPFQREEQRGECDKDHVGGLSVGGGERGSEGTEAQVMRPFRPRTGVKERYTTRMKTDVPLQNKSCLQDRVPVVYCPSLELFLEQYMSTSTPVILSGCMDQWPAYAAKKWSLSYLKQVAGSRTVPVELGSRYTDEDWSQKLMTLTEFIEGYVEAKEDDVGPKGYLAQHQLFDQIPELSRDFSVPEYCYLSMHRSGVSSEAKVNAWFGPKGTLSPLHFDPEHNLLSQVVGRKYIRLYSEDQSPYLYPHDGLLSNTSQVDVESPDLKQFPLFSEASCVECVLYPGHMLYIPPRCWHHVRSLDISFSISFWWT